MVEDVLQDSTGSVNVTIDDAQHGDGWNVKLLTSVEHASLERVDNHHQVFSRAVLERVTLMEEVQRGAARSSGHGGESLCGDEGTHFGQSGASELLAELRSDGEATGDDAEDGFNISIGELSSLCTRKGR